MFADPRMLPEKFSIGSVVVVEGVKAVSVAGGSHYDGHRK
jgi:hypothetical protein